MKAYAKNNGRSITYCLHAAIVAWLDGQEGEIERQEERREALKEEREKAALDAAEKAREDQLARDIAWLERWRLYSPGKPAPWPKDKPIPAGFEDMIDRGEVEI